MTYLYAQTGSTYNKRSNLLAYGAFISKGGKMYHTINGLVGNEEQIKAHNIGGEYEAVLQVLRWCHANKIKGIKIAVAAEVAERLANKQYKPNKEVSHRFVEELSFHMNAVKPYVIKRTSKKNKGLALARSRMKRELQFLDQIRKSNKLEPTQPKKKRRRKKNKQWVKI